MSEEHKHLEYLQKYHEEHKAEVLKLCINFAKDTGLIKKEESLEFE